jgi:type IV pilus assembly protein PilP
MHMRSAKRISIVIALCGTLAACSSDLEELQKKVAEVRSRPGDRIEPLPELRPYESFVYNATTLRSPFVPSPPASATLSSLRPDSKRTREFLEQFPLDTLHMVGTLEMSGHKYGLVKDASGLVHRVLPGQYLGQNDGKIVGVTPAKISVIQIVPDGVGGYIERPAAIALSE